MNQVKQVCIIVLTTLIFPTCKKDNAPKPPPAGGTFNFVTATINDSSYRYAVIYAVSPTPAIKLSFSAPVNTNTAPGSISIANNTSTVNANYTYSNGDSTVIIQPSSPLQPITNYTITIITSLKSTGDSSLPGTIKLKFITAIDSTDKFPQITDSALLTLVEQQTFKYFYDFGHPVSGLARERNTSAEVVTTGGSGFGIMALICRHTKKFYYPRPGT